MEDLLEATIKAHGGHERWNGVRPVTVSFNYYGALLDLKTCAKRLRSAEGFWPLDVRQYVEAERVAGTILEEHGRAGLLVNSVGVSVRSRSWDSVSKQHLKEHLNVKAVWIKTA
jgi:NAD(P)-dependent dehydrogenase (short-subunit alcohol dehydrogenase family)